MSVRPIVWVLASIAILGVVGVGAAGAGAGETVAFVDVNVLPMDQERVLASHTVVVRDGRIAEIGPVAEVGIPDAARRVNGNGTAYLMPGLADMHVHLRHDSVAWLALFVANGVTTVLNMHGVPKHLEMRRAVVEGALVGPTIYTTGPQIGKFKPLGPEDAERLVTEHAEAGYDFVKLYSRNPGDWTREAYETVIATAKARGIAVTGHAPRNLRFDVVLEVGDQSIAHAEELLYTGLDELDEDQIAPVAEQAGRARLWLVTTFASFESIRAQWGRPEAAKRALSAPEARYLHRSIRESWRDNNQYIRRDHGGDWIERAYHFHFPLLKQLHESGVRLMTGTDSPIPVVMPGFSIFRDIELLAEAGLTSYEALKAATRNPGDFIAEQVDPGERFGRVAQGYRADLILLEENPLEDLANLRRRIGVMARGRWFPEKALQAKLEGMAAEFALERALRAGFLYGLVGLGGGLAAYALVHRIKRRRSSI